MGKHAFCCLYPTGFGGPVHFHFSLAFLLPSLCVSFLFFSPSNYCLLQLTMLPQNPETKERADDALELGWVQGLVFM